MKKSEWSDREIEELLMQMPKIQDHRDPRDIYQNLSLKKRKMKSWLLPGLAAAAAVLLFFILVPKLMNGSNFSYDQAQEEKSTMNKDMSLADNKIDSTIALDKDNASSTNREFSGTAKKAELMSTNSIKTALYEEEAGEGTVLTYWIPDPQAQILIPVSIVVTGMKDKSWLTLFNENMANLKEEDWGLSDFYPLKLKMKLAIKMKNNNSITVDVPKDHPYGQGSAMETSLINVLNKDISSNSKIKKIRFLTDGVPGIELGNYGKKNEIEIIREKNHAFFFYYPDSSNQPFITPSLDSYNNIKTALEAMKTDQPELGLKSSLGSTLPIHNVSIAGKTLYVTIKDNANLKNDQHTLSSYEALLLTAKDFGLEKVFIKNSSLTNIGPFDLSKENKVPRAPNLRTIQ
ncbi:hypothetical protein [Neobacillus soli]|uniref:hypothetical protein n=1 Tax=Neobacillus soli TaxID=220688 RepID=UPI000826AF04|nr:hypothetical protein [Neobacillus soli]